MFSEYKGGLQACAAVCAILATPPAAAAIQPTADSEPANVQSEAAGAQVASKQDDATLTDIIVTAQKRAERLQDIPISITALTGGDLTAAGVTSTQALPLAVPSVAFNSTAGFTLPRIRGVGANGGGPGLENPVAIYVDGVYIAAASSGLFSLNNIAQIAVLKGPQGTLFGRNATGGVIQVQTVDPKQDLGGEVHATYASRDTIGGDLYLTGGLAPGLATDLAVYYYDQNKGFGKNLTTGQELGTEHTIAARSKTLWNAGDRTEVRIGLDYSSTRQTYSYRPVYGSVAAGGSVFTGGKFDTQSDVNSFLKTRQGGASVSVKRELGFADLVSITAYRKSKLLTVFDIDRTPLALASILLRTREKQFTQEVQLVSRGGGNFTWVAGGYYFYGAGGYVPTDFFSPFLPPTVSSQNFVSNQRARSEAAFGQASYKLGATTFTGGLRYTHEKRTFTATQALLLLAGGAIGQTDGSGKAGVSKLTWRLSVDHRLSDELLVYASANKGFKSGGFPQALPVTVLAPEQLYAYEAGFKSDLFGRRFRLNGAAYYYDYSNIQLARLETGTQIQYNANGAKIYGVDLDGDLILSDSLSLKLGGAYVHGRYGAIPAAVTAVQLPGGGNQIFSVDAKGNKIVKTPDFAGSATVDFRQPIKSGVITATASYYYSNGWFTDPDNRISQDPYSIFNASVGWESESSGLSVRLWGKNLTNVAYAIDASTNDFADAVWVAPGRQFGITAGLKF